MFPLYDLIPHHRFPWFTLLIILANVGVMLRQGLEPQIETVYEYGFVPKRVTELGSGQPVVAAIRMPGPQQQLVVVGEARLPTDPADVYPTFITAMFLHAHWLHLLGNMWGLWIFGNNVEDRLGHLLFVCFYLLGGIIATLCQWATDPNSTVPMIGASGAVAAIFGGYAITYPWAKVRTLIFLGIPLIVDLPALIVIGFYFVLENVLGAFIVPQGPQETIAVWAHLGGFAAGLVLMPFMSLGASPPGTDWRKEADDMFRFDDPRTRAERLDRG